MKVSSGELVRDAQDDSLSNVGEVGREKIEGIAEWGRKEGARRPWRGWRGIVESVLGLACY